MSLGTGVVPWSQKTENANYQAGKTSQEPLTWTPSQVVAGAASGTLAAASSAVTRRVAIVVPSSADTGVYLNYGATAAAAGTGFFLPAGSSREWDTLQKVNVIRAGAADVTVYVDLGEVA